MGLTQKITDDKAGFLNRLAVLAAEKRGDAQAARTQRDRREGLAQAAGIDLAARLVRSWELDLKAAERAAVSPRWQVRLAAVCRSPRGLPPVTDVLAELAAAVLAAAWAPGREGDGG